MQGDPMCYSTPCSTREQSSPGLWPRFYKSVCIRSCFPEGRETSAARAPPHHVPVCVPVDLCFWWFAWLAFGYLLLTICHLRIWSHVRESPYCLHIPNRDDAGAFADRSSAAETACTKQLPLTVLENKSGLIFPTLGWSCSAASALTSSSNPPPHRNIPCATVKLFICNLVRHLWGFTQVLTECMTDYVMWEPVKADAPVILKFTTTTQ